MYCQVPQLIGTFLILSWQPYIVDAGLGKVQQDEGFEVTGIPEGIPTQAEFLAEYCSAAVRSMSNVRLDSYINTLCTYRKK